MIEETELARYLETLAEKYPKIVMEKLSKETKVQKSLGLAYVVDDVDIDKNLGDFPKGAVPYGPIYRALRNSQKGIIDLFNGSSEAPFSRAYKAGLGECLEKSILVQLSAQRGRKTFLINGYLSGDDDIALSHAYNVVFKDKKPFLVDSQNPLAKDSTGKITHPYIAPILGIKGKYGDFVIKKEWKQGRTYSIS